MSGCCSGQSAVRVVVERLDVDGETCDRCAATLEAALTAEEQVAPRLAERGIALEIAERTLAAPEVAHSNRVLVNGHPVEEWLGGSVSMSECPSCGDLVGQSTCCRAYEMEGVVSESLSANQIARAVLLAAGLEGTDNVSGDAPELEIVVVTGPGCG